MSLRSPPVAAVAPTTPSSAWREAGTRGGWQPMWLPDLFFPSPSGRTTGVGKKHGLTLVNNTDYSLSRIPGSHRGKFGNLNPIRNGQHRKNKKPQASLNDEIPRRPS